MKQVEAALCLSADFNSWIGASGLYQLVFPAFDWNQVSCSRISSKTGGATPQLRCASCRNKAQLTFSTSRSFTRTRMLKRPQNASFTSIANGMGPISRNNGEANLYESANGRAIADRIGRRITHQ